MEPLRGNDGRFDRASGRAAGRKSRGGGRPTNSYRQLIEECGALALRELVRIASDPNDYHRQLAALQVLAKTCVPRITGSIAPDCVELEAAGEEAADEKTTVKS